MCLCVYADRNAPESQACVIGIQPSKADSGERDVSVFSSPEEAEGKGKIQT